MKKLSLLLVVAVLAACNVNKEYDVQKIEKGDKFEKYTVQSIDASEMGYQIILDDEIEIEGELFIEHSPNEIGIKCKLFNSKLKISDRIRDLSQENGLRLSNGFDLKILLKEEWIEETPDGIGLKDAFKGKLNAKLKLTNISLYDDNGWTDISADIVEIIEINGEKPVKPEKKLLKLCQISYQFSLENKISELVRKRSFEKALFFTNDILDFEFYKDDQNFASFIDNLISMGYGIEQAEGHYYIYLDKKFNFTDGEVKKKLKIEEINIGDQLAFLTVKNVKFERPNDSFSLECEGEFMIEGFLEINPMWDEYYVVVDKKFKPGYNISIDGHAHDLLTYCRIDNQKEFKKALTKEQIIQVKKGQIPIKLKAKDYCYGGKISSYSEEGFTFISME